MFVGCRSRSSSSHHHHHLFLLLLSFSSQCIFAFVSGASSYSCFSFPPPPCFPSSSFPVFFTSFLFLCLTSCSSSFSSTSLFCSFFSSYSSSSYSPFVLFSCRWICLSPSVPLLLVRTVTRCCLNDVRPCAPSCFPFLSILPPTHPSSQVLKVTCGLMLRWASGWRVAAGGRGVPARGVLWR